MGEDMKKKLFYVVVMALVAFVSISCSALWTVKPRANIAFSLSGEALASVVEQSQHTLRTINQTAPIDDTITIATISLHYETDDSEIETKKVALIGDEERLVTFDRLGVVGERVYAKIILDVNGIFSIGQSDAKLMAPGDNVLYINEFQALKQTVSDPVFLTKPGSYDEGARQVFLFVETDGASIYYTQDGSIPTTESFLYDALSGINITISEIDIEIKAIAIREGMEDSNIVSGVYSLKGKVLSPSIQYKGNNITGSFAKLDFSEGLTFVNNTDDATISYKWSGESDFTEIEENENTKRIPNGKTSVTVKAVKDGMKDSSEVFAIFEMATAQKPRILYNTKDVEEGSQLDFSQKFTFESDPDDVQFAYKWGGDSTFTTLPSDDEELAIENGKTSITVKALKDGLIESETTEVTFSQLAVAEPVVMVGLLNGDGKTKPVTIISVPNDATIYYTLDNSDPSSSNTRQEYDKLNGISVNVSNAVTLKAIAVKTGYKKSPIKTTFIAQANQVEIPEISVGAVDDRNNVLVTIESATDGASIRYTTDDNDPTNSSGTLYSGPISISVSIDNIIKAIAYKDSMDASPVETKEINKVVASPTFSIDGQVVTGGTVDFSKTLAFNSADSGTFFYTTDGTDPTKDSPSASSISLAGLPSPVTVKVMAVADNRTDSYIVSAEFTKMTDYYVATGGLNNNVGTSSSPLLTVQEAVNRVKAATGNKDDNTMYTIHVSGTTDGGNAGGNAVDITSEKVLKITIIGNSSGVIDGQGDRRVMNVSGENVTVTLGAGLIIQNGKAEDGGGVQVNSGAEVILDGAIISENTATRDGGGIITSGSNSQFTMNSGHIRSNTANSGGGLAVVNGASSNMNNGTIGGSEDYANTAILYSIEYGGGGVFVATGGASFTLSGGTISYNTKDGTGGGIFARDASVLIEGGDIIHNSATLHAGGVAIYGNGTEATMTGGTISANETGDNAGGVYVSFGTIFNMSGGTISNNKGGKSTGNNGGGVYVESSATLNLRGSPTIDSNGTGGSIANSLWSGGKISNIYIALYDRPTYSPVKLIGGLTGGKIGITSFKTGAGDVIIQGANGYRIADTDRQRIVHDPTSSNDYFSLDTSGETSIKNPPTTFYVRNGGDDSNGGTTLDQGFLTVQRAVNKIHEINDETTTYTINVSGITYGGNVGGNAVDITSSETLKIIIQGSSSGAIDGQNNKRGIIVSGENVTVTLGAGLTIQHGRTAASEDGGGVLINGRAEVILAGATIVENDALRDGGGVALLEEGTVFRMNAGTIRNNIANAGGGLFIANGADAVMSGGTIGGSAANANNALINNWGGGGVYVSGSNSTFEMTSGEISYNTAHTEGYGGGIYLNETAALYFRGSAVVANNTAGTDVNNVQPNSETAKIYVNGDFEDMANIGIMPFSGSDIGSTIVNSSGHTIDENDMYAFVNDADDANGFKAVGGNLLISNTFEIGDVGPGGGFIYSLSDNIVKETSLSLGLFYKEFAVDIAEEYTGGGNADWFLPTLSHLESIYGALKTTVLSDDTEDYLALEVNNLQYTLFSFDNGVPNTNVGDEKYSVRAILYTRIP